MSTGPSGFEARIAMISPVLATEAIDVQATLRQFRNPNLRGDNFFIEERPLTIETEADVTGVDALCAAHAIPVFGTAETSMRAIASCGGCFAVLDVVAERCEVVEPQAVCHGEDTLLGCTGLAQLASRLRPRLEARGLSAAVVEPLGTTLAVDHGILAVGAPRTGPS
jgi:hypothetical protein